MPSPVTCKRGHRWTPPARKSSSAADRCPVCGEAALVEEVLQVMPADEASDLPVAALAPVAPSAPPASAEVRWAGVRLGPSLPMAVFTSTLRWEEARIGALALYCSDGRWGEAFDEFCHRRLLLPRYDRWAVPGGPAWLAARGDGRTDRQTAREQLDFLVRAHALERIVVITHYGCAYYGELLHQDPDACLPVQMEEARAAAAVLRDWFPSLTAEAYLAMRTEAILTFHRLDG
jgi:hypothetical protein